MREKKIKTNEVILVDRSNFEKYSNQDDVWHTNLKIRPLGNSGSMYILIPKALDVLKNITPEQVIIKLDEKMDIETLYNKEMRQRIEATSLLKQTYDEKYQTAKHKQIKDGLMMIMLGAPNRIEPSDVDLFYNLKSKMEKGFKKYIFKLKKNNTETYILEEDEFINKIVNAENYEKNLRKLGLLDNEINDREMVEAVLKKIFDEQILPHCQQYGEKELEEKLKEYQEKRWEMRK